MHQDPYGNYQLARYIIQTPVYAEFSTAVREFYANSTTPTNKPMKSLESSPGR